MKKKTKNKTKQHKLSRNKPRVIPRGIDSTGMHQSRDTIIHGRFIQQQQEARMLRDAPLASQSRDTAIHCYESLPPQKSIWRKIMDLLGY